MIMKVCHFTKNNVLHSLIPALAITALFNKLFIPSMSDINLHSIRAVARTLIGGVYIHIFRFCPTTFFSNKVDFKRS